MTQAQITAKADIDFPDDSGAVDHIVPPVLCDEYEALIDSLQRLCASPWPCVPVGVV